jgi:hypothetical protein
MQSDLKRSQKVINIFICEINNFQANICEIINNNSHVDAFALSHRTINNDLVSNIWQHFCLSNILVVHLWLVVGYWLVVDLWCLWLWSGFIVNLWSLSWSWSWCVLWFRSWFVSWSWGGFVGRGWSRGWSGFIGWGRGGLIRRGWGGFVGRGWSRFIGWGRGWLISRGRGWFVGWCRGLFIDRFV